MPNFDLAELALKSVCPSNAILYDDKEMPSVMVYIPKFRLCDVLSTADTSIHPAFRVNGLEIPGFYFGKFQSHVYNGRAYSLPREDPGAYVTHDNVVSYSRAKGSGYHEATAAEWAAIALWCHKNGCEPKGNNNFGKDASETLYKAVPTYMSGANIGRVATGTGPATWSHDGTLSGIWDMNGNVWEWVIGKRTVRGELQVIPFNNACDPTCDLSTPSAAWKAINAAATSWDDLFITPDSSGTTAGSVKMDFVSSAWKYSTTISGAAGAHDCDFKNITADASVGDMAKLYLQALAMMPDTALTGDGIDANYGGDHFWANNAEEERCFDRGGNWFHGARGGVFACCGHDPRSGSGDYLGGRVAFVELPTA